MIAATTYSDDRVFECAFDAEPWFRAASDSQITQLAACGWGVDYPADAVVTNQRSPEPLRSTKPKDRDASSDHHHRRPPNQGINP